MMIKKKLLRCSMLRTITLVLSCITFYAQARQKPHRVLINRHKTTNSEVNNLFSLGGINTPNLYNGRPGINIPLFSVRFDGKEISVALSYDYNGLDLNQEASNVGLGWGINFWGTIFRIKNKHSGEYSNGYLILPVEKNLSFLFTL